MRFKGDAVGVTATGAGRFFTDNRPARKHVDQRRSHEPFSSYRVADRFMYSGRLPLRLFSRTSFPSVGHTHMALRSPPRLELSGADGYAASAIPQRGNTISRFPLMLSASQRKERGNG
jgi:hypothetical protein